MSGRLHGYARVSEASDADNLSTQRRALADCERSSRTWAAARQDSGFDLLYRCIIH